MRYMLAIVLPGVSLISMGKVFQGIICLILQCTGVGWPIAMIWAMGSARNYYDDRRFNRLANAFEQGAQPRIS